MIWFISLRKTKSFSSRRDDNRVLRRIKEMFQHSEEKFLRLWWMAFTVWWEHRCLIDLSEKQCEVSKTFKQKWIFAELQSTATSAICSLSSCFFCFSQQICLEQRSFNCSESAYWPPFTWGTTIMKSPRSWRCHGNRFGCFPAGKRLSSIIAQSSTFIKSVLTRRSRDLLYTWKTQWEFIKLIGLKFAVAKYWAFYDRNSLKKVK